jgi:DNA polymerase-3 subunit epsilon
MLLPPSVGVFDLETSGVDTTTDRIVTAFVGVLDERGELTSGSDWMVAPDGWVISDGAAAIHGVSTDDARANGRPAAAVVAEILAALAAVNGPIVAHNASYDLSLLAHEAHRYGLLEDPVAFVHGLDVVDTFLLDKHVDPYRRGSRKLTALAPLYGVELSDADAHGARADAVAAGRVAQKLLTHPAIARMSVTERMRAQKAWAREQRASLQRYKRSHGEPEFAIDLNWPLLTDALALRPSVDVELF